MINSNFFTFLKFSYSGLLFDSVIFSTVPLLNETLYSSKLSKFACVPLLEFLGQVRLTKKEQIDFPSTGFIYFFRVL